MAGWFGYLILTGKFTTSNGEWIPYEPLAVAQRFASEAFSNNELIILAAAGAVAFTTRRLWNYQEIRILVGIAVLVVTVPSVISLIKPVMLGKYFIVLLPAVFYCVAAAFRELRLPKPFVAALFVILGVSFIKAVDRSLDPHQQWRESSAKIREFESCATATIAATPANHFEYHQGYFFPEGRVSFVSLATENLPAVYASPCPVLAWSTLRWSDTQAALIGAGLPANPPNVIRFTRAFLVMKDGLEDFAPR
jgi:hypothetical protein